MAQTRLAGYPQSIGSKVECLLVVDGPSTYAAGGQTIDATACGMKYIEHVTGGASSNATYWVIGRNSGISTTQRIIWIVAATGAEAGAIDLSASSVVIRVVGFL